MYIEPVNPEFQGIRVTRSGGIAGVSETVEVDPNLTASVAPGFGLTNRSFALNAKEAEELMHALGRVVETRPGASKAKGADMFQYDIEIKWNGETLRFRSVDIAADEALHGVMMIAADLLQRDDAPFHVMELHNVPSQ